MDNARAGEADSKNVISDGNHSPELLTGSGWSETIAGHEAESIRPSKTGEIKMSEDSISWGELAELTHATQVERFGWCICEDTDGEGQLADDCPREGANV